MNVDLDIIPLSGWTGQDGPLIVAGPCGAETRDQVLETARGIAATGRAHILRAGIWKPRTRPGSFQGMGEAALGWMQEAKAVTGLMTAVEVANTRHVELALQYGIDVLWIGARTTVNPFYVQEIADALQGVDVPVMIKNPVNPDIQLWIGALERVNRAGIGKLTAIHRGFTSYTRSVYRNLPNWKIAIELKRLLPDLPVLCDVSHIGGRRDLLLPLAQKAFDLEMSGLMIETHVRPGEALSDAEQQVTPAELNALLDAVVIRRKHIDDAAFENMLEKLRGRIDVIDHQIIDAMARRMDVVHRIGEYKRDNDVTILQLERWAQILKDRIPAGRMQGLDEEFVRRLYNLIHNESIRLQTRILNQQVEVKNRQEGP